MTAGLEAWFGESFCVAVLPELRSIISSYVPLVPTFAQCSDGLQLLDKGQTAHDASGETALSCVTIDQLYFPTWRVLIEYVNETHERDLRDAIVGVSWGLLRPSLSHPARNLIGVRGNGYEYFDGYISKDYIWDTDYSKNKRSVFQIHCDLEHGRIYVTPEGGLCYLIAEDVVNLAKWRPAVELFTLHSKATFLQPI